MTRTRNLKHMISTALTALTMHGCADGVDPLEATESLESDDPELASGGADDPDADYTDCRIGDHDDQDELQVEEQGHLRWSIRSGEDHAGADLQVTVLNRASGERVGPVAFEGVRDDAWDADVGTVVPPEWSGDPLQVWFEVLDDAESSGTTRAFAYVNLRRADGGSGMGWLALAPDEAETDRVKLRPTAQIDDPWLVAPDPEVDHDELEVPIEDLAVQDELFVPGESIDHLTDAPDVARASNIKLCFRVSTAFQDNGNGEDYWRTDSPWYARGMEVAIYGRYGVVWAGNLGDSIGSGDPGSGCTPTIANATPKSNGEFDVILTTDDIWINYNWLDVKRCSSLDSDDDCLSSSPRSVGFDIDAPSSNTTTTFTTTPAAVGTFSATMAAAYSLFRHNGGKNNETFGVLLGMKSSMYTGGQVELAGGHEDNKFVVAHEMGHMIGARAAGSRVLTGGSCDDVNITTSTRPCRQQGSGNHSILSKEESRCAMAEGFAHFFAADVFNSHSQDDCTFTYYKRTNGDDLPVIDCEGSSAGFPAGPYDQCWYDKKGYGNELSWMRQFWDIHTYGSGNPSFNSMITWIKKVSGLSDQNAYQKYHAAAQASGVSSTIESAWEGLDAYNTVCIGADPCEN